MFQPNSCPYCGYQPVEESQYCPQCGTYIFPPTPYEPYEQPPYSPPKHKTQDKIVYGGAIIIIAALIIYHIGYTIIQDTEEDNTPPVVLRTEPASGATDVEPQFSLKIFFSEPVTPSYSLHSAFWQIATEDTKIRWIDDQTVEITNLMFQHFGLITIHFSGDPNIQDRAGNVFTEDYSWTFKTRPPKVDILSQTTYREPTYNLIYIYGEVKNQENFNLFLSDFKIKGYDANQNFIGISRLSSETSPVNVNPGEIVPYMGQFDDSNEVVEEIVVEVPDEVHIEMTSRYEGLEVISAEGYFGSLDIYTCYNISGTIKNSGNSFAENIMVTATFYDFNGKVVGAGGYYLDQDELRVTETLDFEIAIYEDECDVVSIDNYKLLAHEVF